MNRSLPIAALFVSLQLVAAHAALTDPDMLSWPVGSS